MVNIAGFFFYATLSFSDIDWKNVFHIFLVFKVKAIVCSKNCVK